MSAAAAVIMTVAGAALIAAVMREVFHTLFHPSGQGSLTMGAFRLVWRATGRLGPRARDLSGPVSLVAVIALWVSMLVLGWTLVYWPALPGSFIFASPLEPDEQDGFVDALYYAWVTQSTLGFGDVAPSEGWLRVLAPLQATIGFGLFTIVVTWVLSVYPALHRQRTAAGLVHAVEEGHRRAGAEPERAHATTLARQLERIADALTSVRVDLVQYPSTFYFAAPRPTLSLAAALPFVLDLRDRAGTSDETRLAAAELSAAVDLLADTLGENHLRMTGAPAREVLDAYRRHHGLEPVA